MVFKRREKDEDEGSKFVIRGRDSHYIPDKRGMGCAYYYFMKKNKHAIAQRCGMTGIKDGYGSLLKRCVRTAIEMRARGITPEDIVTICSANHLNSCVPVIATAFLGAKLCCLDPMLSHTDIVYLMKQARPKMAFVGVESVELIEKAFKEAELEAEIVVFGLSTVHSEFADFFSPKIDHNFLPVEVGDIKETALILFSSGTTGMPKGICLSHYALLKQGYNLVDTGYCVDVVLNYASFYWISTHLIMICCIMAGGCRLVLPKYDPVQFWKLLDQFKVTAASVAPSHALAMFNKGRPEGVDTTNLADLIIGGGPLSGEHVKEIRDIFPGTLIALLYGLTEIAGSGLIFHPNRRDHVIAMHDKPGSCGEPMPEFLCKVVDLETEEDLGPNQRGELRFKVECQLNGYYNMDSSGVWDAKGWLKTGDVAYYDDDRHFYVIDRIKEMLKFQGFHVVPALIEGVLLSHPSVGGAVVIGIPNEEDGDHPAAAVVLRNPEDKVSAENIVEFVEKRVDDRHRLRGGLKFLKKLPMTATGKIKRSDVKKLFLEE